MLNWREIPFVRLLVPLACGILLSFGFDFYDPVLAAVLALLFIGLMLVSVKWSAKYSARWLFGFAGTCFLLLSGYVAGHHHDERNAGDYLGNQTRNEPSLIMGEVSSAPVRKGDWVRVVLKTQAIGPHTDSLSPCSGNLLVFVARDSSSEKIAYGDLVFFHGKPEKIRPPDNPHSFDYGRYLHFRNIHHQFFVRGENWKILESGHGNVFMAKAIAMQSRFVSILKKHLPTEAEFAVGSALILGHRDEMPEDVMTAFSETGAMHILSVSGLHVGIVFVMLNFFFGMIKRNSLSWRIGKVVVLLVCIWVFALVTGAAPSALRSTVMFSFLNIGLAFDRRSSAYNTLASSAFFLLLFDPYLISNVGFQLSYLAVFGIVYFQPKIASLWPMRHRAGKYVWELVCVSLAAQLMTLPLTFYYFNQMPNYFWLTGLILVPLAGFELGAGIALLVSEMIWAPLAAVVGKVLYGLLWFGNQCVFYIQQMPFALVEGIWIGSLMAFLLYLALANGMAAISSKKYKWVLGALGCFLLCSGLFAFSEINGHQARQLVVYKVYKHSAVDFFDGNTAYSLTDAGMEEKALGFATEGHRMAMGMKTLHHYFLEDTVEVATNHFFLQNGFVNFHGTRLGIVDGAGKIPQNQKLELDYLLLRNSPKVTMDDLAQGFVFKKLIIDNSNKKWQVEKWKTQCKELGIDCHDVGEAGAFVLDIED